MEKSETAIQIESYYLDYVNNFISIQAFADHYDLTIEEASILIDLGRMINNRVDD